jgi:hypothetical protein
VPKVDIDSVVENARKEGIPLSEISLFYQNLTSTESVQLEDAGLIAQITAAGMVIAKFPPDGVPLFPEKITAAYCLGTY